MKYYWRNRTLIASRRKARRPLRTKRQIEAARAAGRAFYARNRDSILAAAAVDRALRLVSPF